MPNPTPIRLLSAAALLTLSALAVAQQTPAPEPAQPSEKPPMQKPAAPPSSSEPKSAHPLLGLTAVSSDGTNIGDVRAVKITPDGKVTALHIQTGGFLGFGGKIVEIPEGQFTGTGNKIQLTFTAEQVSKLPAVKDGR
jgi:sporulation protein YlmC with PRC-barrel domain